MEVSGSRQKSVGRSSSANVQHLHMGRTHRSHSTVQAPSNLAKLTDAPTPFLQYKTGDFLYDLRQCPTKRAFGGFKQQLLNQWYSAYKKKVFNYELNCIYKLLDGDYDLSLQLNVERGTLRRKPMRFQNIRQPFNHLRFNFTKLKPAEVLYHLRCVDRPYTADKLDIHALAINASPLERGHCLILPSLTNCLPQILNHTALRIAVDLMLLVEDETFHILFNSLLGQASVNHLHMHALFWPYESGIIVRKCEELCPKVYVLRRPTWLIQAFVFQLKSAANFDEFLSNLTRCAAYLTDENVAHNLFMSRASAVEFSGSATDYRDGDALVEGMEEFGTERTESRIAVTTQTPLYVTAYLFPRRNLTGAKPPTNFNPAAAELAGFLSAHTYKFFESATEQIALRIIDEDAVLPDHIFENLADGLARRVNGDVPWDSSGEGRDDSDLLAINDLSLHRKHSHCYSETGRLNRDSRVYSSSYNHADFASEALTTHELDELSDSFHTVTSPIPPHQLRHFHSFTTTTTPPNNNSNDSPPALKVIPQITHNQPDVGRKTE